MLITALRIEEKAHRVCVCVCVCVCKGAGVGEVRENILGWCNYIHLPKSSAQEVICKPSVASCVLSARRHSPRHRGHALVG